MSTLWPGLRYTPSQMPRWKWLLREHPSAFLLAGQVLGMLVLPMLDTFKHGRPAISVFGLALALLAIATVRSTPALTWVSGLIGLPALVLEIWSAVSPNALIFGLAHGFLAIFYFYVGYGLIAYVFADFWVTKDELFAVGAAFTVFAWAFAYLFLVVQTAYPGSFIAYQGEGQRTFHELLYLSVASFTSVGLSDVVPVLPPARAVVMVEQTAGVLYVAMVISRLVALTAIRQR